jgi:methyl coenzyme M reductase subunit D
MDEFRATIEALLSELSTARQTVVATGNGLYVRVGNGPARGADQEAAERKLQRLWDANPDAVWRIVTEYNRAGAVVATTHTR